MLQSLHSNMVKQIWAPWRMAYLEIENHEEGCIFCTYLDREDGPDNLIIHRGQTAFVLLNRYPYTNGHLMIVPMQHTGTIETLEEASLVEMIKLVKQSMAVLRMAYDARAFNIGANIGAAAGAGIADHTHMHVLPRWEADTNFMATTAETRVIPEALEATYAKLREHWKPN